MPELMYLDRSHRLFVNTSSSSTIPTDYPLTRPLYIDLVGSSLATINTRGLFLNNNLAIKCSVPAVSVLYVLSYSIHDLPTVNPRFLI